MSNTRDSQAQPTNNTEATDKTPEWTLIFYFASDNPLASSIVSQLKAIKDAGFHQQVNVVARFDPHTVKTPSHVFDVNLINKLKSDDVCDIGFTDNDPYVRTLVPDRLWADEKDASGNSIRERLKTALDKELVKKGKEYKPPIPEEKIFSEGSEKGAWKEEVKPTVQFFATPEQNRPTDEPSPKNSLKSFLQFCAREYKAKRYMVFILGHGVVVGNDLFLFDEFAEEHSLTLKDLGQILKDFVNKDLKSSGGQLELISFHSCSMSGLEVAYELKDTAQYMLASEGPAFVGSFPYRQILIRIFNDVEKLRKHGEPIDVKDTVKKIFYYCFYNSYDFQLAGYSYDLALIDLPSLTDNSDGGVQSALRELSEALIAGLTNPDDPKAKELFGPDARTTDAPTDQVQDVEGANDQDKETKRLEATARAIRNLIILSHWDAQSYFEENFTDLLDFCFCLQRRTEDLKTMLGDQVPKVLSDIQGACIGMMRALKNYDRYYHHTDARSDADRRPDNETHFESDSVENEALKVERKPILRSGFAGSGYQYSHGLSIYFPWSRPIGSKMWNNEYADYALMQDTGNSWKNFLEKYFEATMRNTQAEEKKLAGWSVPTLNDDAELLETISGLVFNEYGQLKDDPEDKTAKITGEACACPTIKNYPPITRRASVPVTRSLVNKIRFE